MNDEIIFVSQKGHEYKDIKPTRDPKAFSHTLKIEKFRHYGVVNNKKRFLVRLVIDEEDKSVRTCYGYGGIKMDRMVGSIQHWKKHFSEDNEEQGQK